MVRVLVPTLVKTKRKEFRSTVWLMPVAVRRTVPVGVDIGLAAVIRRKASVRISPFVGVRMRVEL
jgi:hypothetical protein